MKDLFKATTNWYEAALSPVERRQRGHFSTPPPLVEHILDACGYTPQRDLSHLRVLDPACGGGNFLASAAQRLLASGQNMGCTHSELALLVRRNIWGLDPDPVACFLAETRLRQIVKSFAGRVKPLNLHIHQSDALALSWEPCIDLFIANPPYLASKNSDLSIYHATNPRGQTDSYLLFLSLGMRVMRPGGWLGLVLPDPFLARANAARERSALLDDFTIHHLWHLDGVFPAQVGAVVIIAQKHPPAPTHQVTWLREKWNVEAQFSAPTFSPATFASNLAITAHRDGAMQCVPPFAITGISTILQSLFADQPRSELRYLLHDERGALIERLLRALDDKTEQRRLVPLDEFFTISRGEELGRGSAVIHRDIGSATTRVRRGQASPLLSSNMVCNDKGRGEACPRPTLIDARPTILDACHFPLLLGGIDIRPYQTPVAGAWINRADIKKPLARYHAPKLLVVKSTDRLQAALDLQGHVALQTLYLLHPKANVGAQFIAPTSAPVSTSAPATISSLATDDIAGHVGAMNCAPTLTNDLLYYILALLNSRLLCDHVFMLHTAYKWVQPQIEQQVLARLPIPLAPAQDMHDIVERSKQLMRACSEARAVVEWDETIQHLYEEQERAINALYCSVIG